MQQRYISIVQAEKPFSKKRNQSIKSRTLVMLKSIRELNKLNLIFPGEATGRAACRIHYQPSYTTNLHKLSRPSTSMPCQYPAQVGGLQVDYHVSDFARRSWVYPAGEGRRGKCWGKCLLKRKVLLLRS